MRVRVRVASAFALMLVVACKGDVAPKVLAFREVASGIQHATFAGDKIVGHAFLVDIAKTDVSIVPAGPTHKTVDVLAATTGKPHVATNASFFDETGKPMGRIADKGIMLGDDRLGPWGALIIDKGVARIVKGDTLPVDRTGGALVVQGIPRLVVGGEVPKLKPASAERTAVCADGTMLTVVVTTKPVDTTAFARFLARPRDKGGLGCKDALNLDGGPSTQLHANLAALSVDVKGGWGVPNALVVTPR